MIKNYKVRLHVLSPVHIGMGDAYDPTQFVIDKDGLMYVFDTNDFLKSLSPEKSVEFCKLADNANNPVPVFRFFKENFDKNKVKYREVKASKDLAERYEQICNSSSFGKDVINQFELKRTIYNPIKNVPYIPGSSLKGCLKTIWMSETNRQSNDSNKRNPENPPQKYEIGDLEKKVLKGSFSTDPFRLVKVSDLYPIENEDIFLSQIMYAVMFSRKTPTVKNTLPVALEVIPKGNVFEGIITLDDMNDLKNIHQKDKPKEVITMDSLLKDSRLYYLTHPELINNEKKWVDSKMVYENKLLQSSKFGAMGLNLRDMINKLRNNNCFPVRLGHHSSAEFITIDGCRSVKITPPGVKPAKYSERATSIWLASSKRKPENAKGLQSFGWALLEFEEIK